MSYLVVRVRSDIKVRQDIKDTMQMLNLSRVNHATIIQETPQNEGMLHKAKDYITWGKIDVKTLESLLRNRGRLAGDHPLTDAAVSAGSQHENIEGFAAALASNDTRCYWAKTDLPSSSASWNQRLGRHQAVFCSRWCFRKPWRRNGRFGYSHDLRWYVGI